MHMHHHFDDIVSKLGTPLWYDRHGYPRYCEFSPDVTSDIYARECVLLEIACSQCDARFKVARHRGNRGILADRPTLATQIRDDAIGYGDPPNARCCSAGSTMKSDPVRVLEYWEQTSTGDWQRGPELEIALS